MVDVHSHILWGLDDGPKSIDQSIAMLRAAAESGTTDIVATPHLNPRYTFDRSLTQQKIAELTEATNGLPRIHIGCEFHLTFDNVDLFLQSPSTYTINGQRYLLLECPNSHIGSHTESILKRFLEAGIVPVIAHPERNPILASEKSSRLEAWVELGCLTQVTALSIMGGFGASAKASSMRLIERGLVHVVASDTHDIEIRHPRLSDSHGAISARFGSEAAEILFVENPQAIVKGEALPGGKQTFGESSTPWYRFWKRPV